MSLKSLTDISKIQWLKSVRAALTGFIGTLFLLILLKIWQGIDNPNYLSIGFPINTHYCDAVFLGIFNIAFIIVLAFWTPVEQGTRENEAKLFHINWMKSVEGVEALLKEEEKNLEDEVIKTRIKEILEATKDVEDSDADPLEVDSDITLPKSRLSNDTYTANDKIDYVYDTDGTPSSNLYV